MSFRDLFASYFYYAPDTYVKYRHNWASLFSEELAIPFRTFSSVRVKR